ncbi:PrsW family glutamic-type intramembrane protease [Algisphaera agarilytica]|uniref:Putative Zn-ribbon and HTH transcriptional regulator n=1 Tax=Algisphaera agarilytica TaxID=1385975 RepID=A0A7X0H7G2_9BACT|nr:PrsW family glutamic-type intramembrane protease [Algisphaera agarilytica]MBB6430692.1 putative Zn-ribbon and HTH transcriptional regulator [Algisphaera agarilytica]
MPKPKHQPGIENEPHLSGQPFTPDPAEARAVQKLSRQGPDAAGVQAHHDVFDEPVMRVRPGELITRDWSCDQCGYNLRGTKVGEPCPECGHKLLLAPTTDTQGTGYSAWLVDRMALTSAAKSWGVVLGIMALGGPWAVLGAFIATFGGVLAIVVVGPAVEEVMKIGLIALIIEVRPYLFRSRGQIYAAAVGSGLMFAVIENLIYLNIYFPNPGADLIAWRWVVCTALHVGCSAVAAIGAVAVWQTVVGERRRPRRGPVELRWLVLAILIHGAYNAAVTVAEVGGYIF